MLKSWRRIERDGERLRKEIGHCGRKCPLSEDDDDDDVKEGAKHLGASIFWILWVK